MKLFKSKIEKLTSKIAEKTCSYLMLASVTLNIIWKSYLLGKMNMTGWNGKSLKIVGLTVNTVKDIVKVAVSAMLANVMVL